MTMILVINWFVVFAKKKKKKKKEKKLYIFYLESQRLRNGMWSNTHYNHHILRCGPMWLNNLIINPLASPNDYFQFLNATLSKKVHFQWCYFYFCLKPIIIILFIIFNFFLFFFMYNLIIIIKNRSKFI